MEPCLKPSTADHGVRIPAGRSARQPPRGDQDPRRPGSAADGRRPDRGRRAAARGHVHLAGRPSHRRDDSVRRAQPARRREVRCDERGNATSVALAEWDFAERAEEGAAQHALSPRLLDGTRLFEELMDILRTVLDVRRITVN